VKQVRGHNKACGRFIGASQNVFSEKDWVGFISKTNS